MKIQAPHAVAACFTSALLLACAAPIASGQALKTIAGDLLIPAADGRLVVERPDGQRVELPLPASARIGDFRSAGDDWLVAAVSRVEGAQMKRLELLQGRGDQVESLPSPALEPTAELMQPVFVADRQGFQALVWLAGDAHHQLALKASRWLAGGWGPTETLSPPGEGTQIAPSTAVLDDGTWLVAWAAFDGSDDEILWSRFAGGLWSQPRPIAEDNAVPDVTPHLFATAGGALAAWSRFDGNDYRVNVARFDGERWSAPIIAGPAGSTDPMFSGAERPYLIYRHADPPAWAVIELDAGGAVLREATDLAHAGPQRPVIGNVSEKTVSFEWLSLERQKVSAPVAWVER